MKTELKRIGLTVAIALSFAGGAVAQERKVADSNGDGSVSFAELQAVRPQLTQERYAAMDSNADGQLSRDEMRAAAPERPNRPDRPERQKLDTNGDGKVSLAEMQAARPRVTAERFGNLDNNGDGFLSRDEIEAKHENFQELDGDNSGGLSLDELRTRRGDITQDRFDRMDRNNDGQIGQGDFRRGRAEGQNRPGRAPR